LLIQYHYLKTTYNSILFCEVIPKLKYDSLIKLPKKKKSIV